MMVTKEPEFESVESFVEYLREDERDTFTVVELAKLAAATKTSRNKLREVLEVRGLTLAVRGREETKVVRGFTANSHNRWSGNPCGGGSGWEQINGFAGRNG